MSLSVLVIYLNSVSLIECLVYGGGLALCGLIGMHSEPHGNREVQWGARKGPWCLVGLWECCCAADFGRDKNLLTPRLPSPTHPPTHPGSWLSPLLLAEVSFPHPAQDRPTPSVWLVVP